MERKKKTTVCSLSLLVLLAAVWMAMPTATPVAPANGLKEHGLICTQVTRADGTVEPAVCNHNLITTGGKNMIRDDMMGTADVTLNQLALGNATTAPAVGDTALPGLWSTCGMTKTAGTLGAVSTGNWSIYHEFTSTCDTVYVNATAIYNATGNTFAEASWNPTTTLMNGDKINVSYTCWVA